ncbi:MAG: 6-phosphogluconolactonase [Burkholderiales bacterium]
MQNEGDDQRGAELLHEFPDAPSAAAAQADAVARLLRDALSRSASTERAAGASTQLATGASGALLAVSGGRSPVPFFERLAAADLDWSRTVITLVDERLVAPTHEQSNERLVREHLLQQHAEAARFDGLMDAGEASDLAQRLDRLNRDAAPIDVAVLGMGEDGHTASLFKGAPEYAAAIDLANPDRYCVIHPPIPPVDPPHPRISMTLAALLSADRLILAISGAAKREVFERAARQPRTDLPISLLLDAAKTKGKLDVYWHP